MDDLTTFSFKGGVLMLNKVNSWLNNLRSDSRRNVRRGQSKRSNRNSSLLVMESLEERAMLTAGVVDLSFGNNLGRQTTDFSPVGGTNDAITAMARQEDGKILAAGVSGQFGDGAIARYNADGTLDTTFGSGGFVRSVFFEFGGVKDMALGALNGGVQSIYVTGTSNGDIGVLKMSPDGAVDTTFGTNGIAFANFPQNTTAEAIAVQTVGGVEMLVAAGHTLVAAADSNFAVARFNASSGLRDTAGFNAGNDGRQTIAFDLGGNNDDRAFDVQIASNNDILLTGYATTAASGHDFAVARLVVTGTAANFNGAGGKRTINTSSTAGGNDEARSLAVDGTGASEVIYLGGFADGTDNQDFAIVKIPGSGIGTIGAFGTAGIKLHDFRSGIQSNDQLFDLKLQGDNVVAVGSSAEIGGAVSNVDFAVASLNSTTGVANSSEELTTFTTYQESAAHALIFDGTNWLVGGATGLQTDYFNTTYSQTNFAVAKYTNAGSLDKSGAALSGFGPDGRLITDLTDVTGRVADDANDSVIQADGKILVAGVTNNDFVTSGIVSRYLPNGTLDESFGANGRINLGAFNSNGITGIALGAPTGGPGTEPIYVTGTINSALTGLNDIAVASISPAGEFNTTFGTNGIAFANFPQNTTAEAIAVQTVGGVEMLVAAGHTLVAAADSNFAVARFNASSGLRDTAGFNAGNDGRQTIAFDLGGNNDDRAFDVQIASNNDILLTGYATTAASGHDFAVARLVVTGTAANFNGAGGKRTINTSSTAGGNDEARSLAVDGTGASEVIYLGGFADGTDNQDFAIVKIPGSGIGTIGAFGTAGIKLHDFRSGVPSSDQLFDLQLQGGNVVAVGRSSEIGAANKVDFAVASFNSGTGTLGALPNQGQVNEGLTSFYSFRQDSAATVSIQADGNWVVSGSTGYNAPGIETNIALARYISTTGALDPAFADDGLATTDFSSLSGSADKAAATVVQADGKILVAGFTRLDFGSLVQGVVSRYNQDGKLDPTFGANGQIVIGAFNSNGITGIALGAPTGGPGTEPIYVTGTINSALTGLNDIAVASISPAGEFNTTFGTNGIAFANFPQNTTAEAIAVQTVGGVEMLVAAGHTLVAAADSNFAVARFNASSGLRDTAGFNAGNDGRQTIAFDLGGNNDDRAFDVQIASNNDILLTGYATTAASGHDFAVARLVVTGTAANFNGAGGKRTINTSSTAGGNDEARSLAVDGTGASEVIYLGGFADGTDNQDFAIVKIPGSGIGTIGAFGTAGIKLHDFRSGIQSNDQLFDLKLQGDNVVAVGSSAEIGGAVSNVDFAVASFNSTNGDANPIIGTTGLFNFFTFAQDAGAALAIQSNGKWVIAGSTGVDVATPNGTNFALIRLQDSEFVTIPPAVDLNGAEAGTGFTVQFATGGVTIAAATATVVDTDSAALSGATATLTNFQTGDTLAVTESGGITSAFAAGVLTLSGSATPDAYQTVLRTLVFNTTSTDTATRTIDVKVNDGALDSAVATATVTFQAGGAPIVDLNGAASGTGFTVQFATGGVTIAAATATVVDTDSATLSGATATLTNFQTGDTLSVTESGGITSAFAGGVLTLSGSASPDAYQTVLRTLVFNTTSTDKTTRTIDVKANDGTSDSAIATATVTFPGPVGTGDLTGDGKVDSTDGFLVVLIDAGASDETINRLKGSSTLTAAEIRQRLTTSTVLDVNEDGKTDSTDGFLVVLVDSSASLDTINRLKFNDAITGQKVQSNVQALLNGTVTATASGFLAAAAVGPTQVITASSNVTEAKAGDTIEVQVNYSTLNSPTDPSNQNVQNLALRLHYDSTQMTFKGFKAVAGGGFDILADGLTQPDPGGLGNLGAFLNGEDDTSNFDIAEDTTGTGTNKFFNVIWGKAAGGFPPGAEPVKLYTAVFEATAAFKGAEVNFSAAKTANSFSLQSNSLAIADSTAPKQVITVGPPPGSATIFAAAGVGQTVEVPVFYSTQNSPTTPTNQNVQNLALRLHYDSTQLTFKGFKAIAGGGFDILTDGLTQPDPGGLGNLGTFLNGEDDTTNFDSANDATGTETNKFFNVIWGKAAGGFPLGTEPVKLYTAVFETTAAYTSSTEINFSAAKTANGFSLLSSSAAINTVPIGPAPTANADGPFNVQTGKTITGNVLTNDNDNGAPPLTAALKTNVTNGTLVLNSDGSFTYTPNAGYIGPDSFVYTATNSNGSADATVSLNVTAVPNITGDGNVRVIYRHGNLIVLGDTGNNSLQISGDGTNITLQGLGNTTVNGSSNAYVIAGSEIPGFVLLSMSLGNDTVGIQNLKAGGTIGVAMGMGNDILELKNVQSHKDLWVNGGLGNDRVSMLNSSVSRNVILFGSLGSDQIGLKNVQDGNHLIVAGSIGDDRLIIDQTSVGGSAVVIGGGGADAIGIDASSVADDVAILGIGNNNVAQISANNTIGGQVAINGVKLASQTDPLFAQYRNDLFDSLLFS
jgi:uncharacterized delta-60 repeat protein